MLLSVADLIEARVGARAEKRPARPRRPSARARKPMSPPPPSEDQDQAERDQRRKRVSARADKQVKAAQNKKATRKADAAARTRKVKDKGVPPSIRKVPAQLAHCMMALHAKRGKSKDAAWNICRWSLQKNGYLKTYRKNAKMPKATAQTQKGSRRTMQHAMEKKPLGGGVPGDGPQKFKKFVKMFSDFESEMMLKKRKSRAKVAVAGG